MEFIVLVLALLIRLVLSAMPNKKHDLWFNLWCDLCGGPISGSVEQADTVRVPTKKWGIGTLMLSVVLPVIILGVVLELLTQVAWGLPAFALSLLILLYSFSREDSEDWFKQFQRAWRRGDHQAAYEYARQVIPKHTINSEYELFLSVFSRLLYLRFCDFFMVLFWFMVLGAEGALLVRLSQLLDRDRVSPQVLRIRWLLEWLPARLLGISFMLTGHISRVGKVWLATLFNGYTPTEHLLYRYARAAMDHNEPPEVISDDGVQVLSDEYQKLLSLEGFMQRSVVLWLVVIALATILADFYVPTG